VRAGPAPVDPLACAAFLLTAFVLAGLLHSAWLGSPASRRFAVPLDGGRRFRGRRLLGDNKTLRGFAVMVPGAGLTFLAMAGGLSIALGALPTGLWQLSPLAYGALGAWSGLGFMLGELPNSFVKRQLRVAPGGSPRGSTGMVLCFAVDRLDSIVGMLAAVSVAVPTSWATWGYMLLLGPVIHWSFSVLLFRMGVKARPA
jgi:CDP-archaeol synthase